MRLQRITTSSRWIPEIDGMRFIAIVSVVAIHVLVSTFNHMPASYVAESYSGFITRMYQLGRGVQLFFVISGFILAQPFLRQFVDGGKPVSVRAFYMRRLTRLEPPYMIAMLIYAVVGIVARHLPWGQVGLSLLSNLTYTHNLFQVIPRFADYPTLNGVTWTLEIEIQFYLLLPLFARVFLLPAAVRRSVLCAVIAASALIDWTRWIEVGVSMPGQLCFFFVGILLADLHVRERAPQTGLWDVVSLIGWPLYFLMPDARWTNLAMCVLLAACFTASLAGPFSRRILSTRAIALTGGMCYSIYLFHLLCISFMTPVTRRVMVFRSLYAAFAVEVVLLLPVILAVSTAYFVLVERPCMDPEWPRKLVRKLRGDTSGELAV